MVFDQHEGRIEMGLDSQQQADFQSRLAQVFTDPHTLPLAHLIDNPIAAYYLAKLYEEIPQLGAMTASKFAIHLGRRLLATATGEMELGPIIQIGLAEMALDQETLMSIAQYTWDRLMSATRQDPEQRQAATGKVLEYIGRLISPVITPDAADFMEKVCTTDNISVGGAARMLQQHDVIRKLPETIDRSVWSVFLRLFDLLPDLKARLETTPAEIFAKADVQGAHDEYNKAASHYLRLALAAGYVSIRR
jgi:hypothetical protein